MDGGPTCGAAGGLFESQAWMLRPPPGAGQRPGRAPGRSATPRPSPPYMPTRWCTAHPRSGRRTWAGWRPPLSQRAAPGREEYRLLVRPADRLGPPRRGRMVGQLDRARPGTQLRGGDSAALRRLRPGGQAPRLPQPRRTARATLLRLVSALRLSADVPTDSLTRAAGTRRTRRDGRHCHRSCAQASKTGGNPRDGGIRVVVLITQRRQGHGRRQRCWTTRTHTTRQGLWRTLLPKRY
jgi:hypothetical protein